MNLVKLQTNHHRLIGYLNLLDISKIYNFQKKIENLVYFKETFLHRKASIFAIFHSFGWLYWPWHRMEFSWASWNHWLHGRYQWWHQYPETWFTVQKISRPIWQHRWGWMWNYWAFIWSLPNKCLRRSTFWWRSYLQFTFNPSLWLMEKMLVS